MSSGNATIEVRVDTAEALRQLYALARQARAELGGMLVAGDPPARRTRSADRTRSPRWRAGSRRTGRMARAARRQGRPSPFAEPFARWVDMGWLDEQAV